MATISGQGTTFNLPNYHGELYSISPSDTPFLSAIGGLLGGGAPTAKTYDIEWQTEDLETTSVNNSKVEGAVAPAASEVSRSNVQNVLEIHQEAFEVSYTKQATSGMYGGFNMGVDDNPVRDELNHQAMLKLRKVAVDVEKSFLTGAYARPANNATARTTRGVLTAVSTNVFANGAVNRANSKVIMDAALAAMFTAGSPLDATTVLMTSATQKVNLSNLYSTATLNQPTMTRNVGGVAIDTLVTDFGTLGVMVNRWFPANGIGVINLGVCKPRFLEIPDKGVLFAEPLGLVGASTKYQLYGEIGLEYGPETWHGWIKDLT